MKFLLIQLALTFSGTLTQAQGTVPVPITKANRTIHEQYCFETLMYFNIPFEKAIIDSCLLKGDVRIRARNKMPNPDVTFDIEGTAQINKFVYVCQGAVRKDNRVVLKNCIEMVLF